MDANDSIKFNQIRNYKRCFADAAKMVVRLPSDLVRSLCLLWGISSIGLSGLLYITLFSESNWSILCGIVLVLFVLWLQSMALSKLSFYIHDLRGTVNKKTASCSLKGVVKHAINYFVLRIVQTLILGIVPLILTLLHVPNVYVLIVCVLALFLITYMDLYFVSDTFLSTEKFLNSLSSSFRKCLKNISISFIIYVSVAFFMGVSLMVLYTPTFVLSCGLGAQKFASQIGDSSNLIPFWVYIFHVFLMMCVFIVVNFILTFCRFAAVLFENAIILRQEEKVKSM